MNNDSRWLHLHSSNKDQFIPVARISSICADLDNDNGSYITLFGDGGPISVDEDPSTIMEMMCVPVISSTGTTRYSFTMQPTSQEQNT